MTLSSFYFLPRIPYLIQKQQKYLQSGYNNGILIKNVLKRGLYANKKNSYYNTYFRNNNIF